MAISITVNEQSVPLVALDMMTLDELDLLKEMTGLGAQAAATEIEGLDPAAWRAVILISVQRVDPTATAADLAGVHLFEIMAELDAQAKAEQQADDAAPPILTPSGLQAGNGDGKTSGSGESTTGSHRLTAIPADSGVRG